MKKVSVDVWVQLIGMLSVLAGLLFVGLEMRQSQEIAISATHQARSQVLIDMINTCRLAGKILRVATALINLIKQVGTVVFV